MRTVAVTIELTGVRATVGAVAEGGRIPFELVPGTPSAATLLLAVDKPRNLVYGTFLGDLYTKKAYTLARRARPSAAPRPRGGQLHRTAGSDDLRGGHAAALGG